MNPEPQGSLRPLVDDEVDRPGVEALQGAELTGTNRSCGLITIIFFVRDTPFMRSSRLIALKTPNSF